MSRQELYARLDALFEEGVRKTDHGGISERNWAKAIDWKAVNEIIAVDSRVIWEPRPPNNFNLVNLAVIDDDLNEIKFLNNAIREGPFPSYVIKMQLKLAFEIRPSNVYTPIQLAIEESPDLLRYLVEECCPSGVKLLDTVGEVYHSPIWFAITERNVDALDYILTHAPRGLTLLDDALEGKDLWTYVQQNADENTDIEELQEIANYLAKVKTIFLARESNRAIQALEDLEAEGFELPALMLGVLRDNTGALIYRESLK